MATPAAPVEPHDWRFFRTGGLDQVALETGVDLLALGELDQKLWVALSCPVKGLEIDEKTLALIDADGDGHIRAPELIAAIKWAAIRLRNPSALLTGSAVLQLDEISESTPEGQAVRAAARRIVEDLRITNPNGPSITLDDTAKIFSQARFNGDGIVPVSTAADPGTQAVINDIITCIGSETDRSGAPGVNQAQVDAFFTALTDFVAWARRGEAEGIAVLGDATAAAFDAINAVRAKVDDYFARAGLAAFDPRALAALNVQEGEYLTLAAKDLKFTSTEIAALPLAKIDPGQPLPLVDGVNPAWAEALARLRGTAIDPVLGAGRNSLTAAEWATLTGEFAAYAAWLASKPGSAACNLGLARAQAILAGKSHTVLNFLIAEDAARAAEFGAIDDVVCLLYYLRDLRALLHNFVNFADFYSHEKWAVFQSGTLYLDNRSCELCIRVDNPDTHASLARTSEVYIAYVSCRRANGETMNVAACFTQGDSDHLVVGRNGVFYDRQGRDWDATIVKIIERPISLRQAFWSPYKKLISTIEEQFAQRAASTDSDPTGKLAALTAAAPGADKGKAAHPRKIDVGTVAALGVGIGAIGGALATLSTGLARLAFWQIPVVIILAILAISLPSVLIAWIKLRRRTLGPILDANGWAINGRVQINLPLGTALTGAAMLPANSYLSFEDPYEDKAAFWRRFYMVGFIILAVVALALSWEARTWPFRAKPVEETPAIVAPATPVAVPAAPAVTPKK